MSGNFTYQNRFKFEFTSLQYKELELNIQQVSFPSVILGTIIQPSTIRNIYLPGSSYELSDLTLTFIVDEYLKSWISIFRWIKSCKSTYEINQNRIYSDANLLILNNNSVPKVAVKFFDIFPYQLSEIQYSTTDQSMDPPTSTATFKINDFDIIETV